jgi:hypothetical protein
VFPAFAGGRAGRGCAAGRPGGGAGGAPGGGAGEERSAGVEWRDVAAEVFADGRTEAFFELLSESLVPPPPGRRAFLVGRSLPGDDLRLRSGSSRPSTVPTLGMMVSGDGWRRLLLPLGAGRARLGLEKSVESY